MLHIAYYETDIPSFCKANEQEVLGALAEHHGFSLEIHQRFAWQEQIRLLQICLTGIDAGLIFFEFSIPRMGKRADVVLLIGSAILVIEFKVGSDSFDRAAMEQVHDYALDLKNFHRGSHHHAILPILIATQAPCQTVRSIEWASDGVAKPIGVSPPELHPLIVLTLTGLDAAPIDAPNWARSGYKPTPTIVEAAQSLYRDHDVREISRSDAGAKNLGLTADCLAEIIEHSKRGHRKAICFVTGVPGSGKTLAGLNVATARAKDHSDEHAVFLSGNGPLVEVLREALARDQSEREGISKKDALRKVASFVQNIHHFRDEALKDSRAPAEKVVIFDEAQRAWDRDQTAKFMQQKRGYFDFDESEPAFLISVMDRHDDWCVIICLVGGGQEINTGEAGLAEWLSSISRHFSTWDTYISNRLEDRDYIWDSETSSALASLKADRREALHLSVSMRSFRAESLSEFAGHVVENRSACAREAYAQIADRYPIVLTRDLQSARTWLRNRARGSERYGLLASSGASRLRPEGIFIKAKIDAPTWFLNNRTDVRASYYMEEVATEFDVQGLELDWSGVCWDADFRYEETAWKHFSFRGTTWQRVNAKERQLYLKNAYRVILTRARQGMVIYVPVGSLDDPTRRTSYYDQTYDHLCRCGLMPI
ncbi:DUF2075 domain-containing protein [Propionivibrio sp.]|uniref:DUF2075 domain-containing protein n=1 Tax=Propionivibrio sp. TaxID=2212460 RepID=UPI0025F0D7A1|nr:DUF2075 domain-containing protein [Propionivibrio sp.]MBK7356209.1 DUF2075 domain-containing protein [Propionivibrio sp.]MBK8746248.1 DUF2075 domain-containing protein [Propionivibrio sp.]MBL0208407.1 DUF2075 domain-containing protein [Propionivibrio sp.]